MESVVEKMRRLEQEIKNLQKNNLLLKGKKSDNSDSVNSKKLLKKSVLQNHMQITMAKRENMLV